MARRKDKDGELPDIVEGTVEHARREFFEKEKAAYEERTGETVNYVPDHPLTSTPLPAEPGETPAPGEAEGEG